LAEQANAAPQGSGWSVDPLLSQKLLTALKQAAERMAGRGHQPVILCSPSLRRHLRKLTDRILHAVPVLGLNEVDSVVRLQAVETVRVDMDAAETRSLA
jgi:flagellar biosynthesis protein FlhA